MAIYGIKDAADLIVKKKKDGKVLLSADYCNTTTNDWTSERVYAMKKGVKAIGWDGNKESTLQLEMEIFDLAWIAMMTGSDFVNGATDIMKREVLTVTSGKVVLNKKPKSGSFSAFTLEKDNITHKTELTVTATQIPEDGKYLFDSEDAEGKTIKLNSVTCPDGSKIVAYYLEPVAVAKTMEIKADKFPESYEVFAATKIREQTTGVDEYVDIHYPNVRPKSNFTITMSADNVTNLSVEFDLFPDENNNMAIYKIIE